MERIPICLLTSTSKRHAYLAHRLREHFDLALIVREEKGIRRHYAGHPDRRLIEDHFQRLARTEELFFGEYEWGQLDTDIQTVPWGGLNTEDQAARIRQATPRAVAVFGCGIIKPPVLNVLPQNRTFNIHQGLSPYYRGGATNFWPFVEGNLHHIGVTLHLIDAGIDTGGILAHGRPEINDEDTQHSLGCKTIQVSADLMIRALKSVENGERLDAIPQWRKGILHTRKELDGAAIQTVRERERSGYVREFLRSRSRGEISPLQLITLDP